MYLKTAGRKMNWSSYNMKFGGSHYILKQENTLTYKFSI